MCWFILVFPALKQRRPFYRYKHVVGSVAPAASTLTDDAETAVRREYSCNCCHPTMVTDYSTGTTQISSCRRVNCSPGVAKNRIEILSYCVIPYYVMLYSIIFCYIIFHCTLYMHRVIHVLIRYTMCYIIIDCNMFYHSSYSIQYIVLYIIIIYHCTILHHDIVSWYINRFCILSPVLPSHHLL